MELTTSAGGTSDTCFLGVTTPAVFTSGSNSTSLNSYTSDMFFSILVAVDSKMDLMDNASLLSSLFCAGVNVDEESFFSVGSTVEPEAAPASLPLMMGMTFSILLSPVSFFSARRAASVVVEDPTGVTELAAVGGSEMPALPGMVDRTAAETAVAVVAAAIAVLLMTVATISSWTLIIFELFDGVCTEVTGAEVAAVAAAATVEPEVPDANVEGLLDGRGMGSTAATTVVVVFSSGSKCDGLEITGAGTSLAGAGAGAGARVGAETEGAGTAEVLAAG